MLAMMSERRSCCGVYVCWYRVACPFALWRVAPDRSRRGRFLRVLYLAFVATGPGPRSAGPLSPASAITALSRRQSKWMAVTSGEGKGSRHGTRHGSCCPSVLGC